MISAKQKLYSFKAGALFIASTSLVSQIFGFVRDKLLAHHFGAGALLDVYYTALRVPEFVYLSIGSLVSSAILVPIFMQYKDKEDDQKIWFKKVFFSFSIFFIILFSLIAFLLPYVINAVYGHSGVIFQSHVVMLSRVLLVSTFFLSLSSIATSVLQSKHLFVRLSLAPILYNIGIILGILVFAPYWGILGVVLGVVLGALLHLAVQLPPIIKSGFFNNITKSRIISFTFIKKIILISFPRTLSLIASAVGFFLISYFASYYKEGSVTILQFAFTMQTIFHTLIGVSLATIIFPKLSSYFHDKKMDLFHTTLVQGIYNALYVSLPVCIIVFLTSSDLVRILFGGGNFTLDDTQKVATALFIFTTSLFAQNAILIYSKSWYAKGLVKLPLYVNTLAVLLFALSYKVSVLMGFNSLLAVPLGYTLGQWGAYIYAYFIENKSRYIVLEKDVYTLLLSSVVISCAIGFVVFILKIVIYRFLPYQSFAWVCLKLFLVGGIYILLWLVFSYRAGIPVAVQIYSKIQSLASKLAINRRKM